MSNNILKRINSQEFPELFISELHWNIPKDVNAKSITSTLNGENYSLSPVGKYQGLTAWVCNSLPKRSIRTELSKELSKQNFDYVLIFSDGENQVWTWPSISETRLGFRRLTAQHHRVGDKNDALARRLDRFKIDPKNPLSVADLLISVKNGFDTDTEAALRIADLHSHLLSVGLEGTDLEVFLTRLLFLFFGEDTDLFAQGPYDAGVAFRGDVSGGDEFRNLIVQYPDGTGFRELVQDLFAALRTPIAERINLSSLVKDFPYVNGGLFQDEKPVPEFDEKLIELVLACSNLDWSDISPAIFGSMFEGLLESTIEHVVNSAEGHVATRRQLGAHYTSEENILRVIEPLFLGELNLELENAGIDPVKLKQLHAKISSLTFFDPACGCGNFLVVTYKELRHIENMIIERLLSTGELKVEDVPASMTVRIDQFFGIEISASASQVAQVAMWITDHQMNVESFERFERVRHSIPLAETPGIVRADALTYPWDEVIPAEDCDFIIGNPPYLGKSNQDDSQKASFSTAMAVTSGAGGIRKPGILDFVSAWLVKSAIYMKKSTDGGITELALFEEEDESWGKSEHKVENIPPRLQGTFDNYGTKSAFVTTNSITQGEQASELWPWLLSQGLHLQFAHSSFKWTNNNPGAAQVFCVILGLGFEPTSKRELYVHHKNEIQQPTVKIVENISPYLVPGSEAVVETSKVALFAPREIVYGSMPNDGGNLILSVAEAETLIREYPESKAFVRNLYGAREFMSNSPRKCLWFQGMDLADVRKFTWAKERIEATQKYRLNSDRPATRALAQVPHLFGEIRHTGEDFLLIPCNLPSDRSYFAMGFKSGESISTNLNHTVPSANLFDFGILSSAMHNAWIRFTAGGLGDGLRYSSVLVYNTFPWPFVVNDIDAAQIYAAAQNILDIRESFSEKSMTDLYRDQSMPSSLREAHEALDDLVDVIYAYRGAKSEEDRFEFLMAMYMERKSKR
ncbi:putative DNA methyltransferase YeeA [Aurantimicrobium sp. INA4]|uniref:class I SAM-dependent DNA methyltransferase n=1 Tax=Aurantimicrobium sp. INA4 TaxID=2986279 RepID=UPI00249221C5|nr:DNA methyltransferase [Aurantimicrobium sp. INA4]BDU10319.1 putative DNA methyltransferase YeeA [Aurantimicrobium sp. INA4]